MSSDSVDLVVVGGGISGLGFAHMAARKGIRPLVLEAGQRVGGALCSHQFSTPEGDFWTELGAHTCYNSYGNLLQILEDLGCLDGLLAKEKLSYRLLTPHGIKSIPSQLGFVELIRSLPRLFSLKKQGQTVGGYFAAIVGAHNYRRVVGPALDAVICQDASQFPAEALFRKKPRRKEIIRNFTVAGGVETFARKIAQQPALDVRTGAAVSEIRREDGGYQVITSEGDAIFTRKLVMAVAPDVAARLLAAQMPDLAEVLESIEMVQIESVSVLLPAQKCGIEPLAGIIAPEDRFFSAVSRDPVPDDRYRGFSFHFRPEGLDIEAKLLRICQVLGVQREDVMAVKEQLNRLPALRLGLDVLVSRLDQLIGNQPIAFTGNWFSGVSIEDSLIRSASECGRLCRNA